MALGRFYPGHFLTFAAFDLVFLANESIFLFVVVEANMARMSNQSEVNCQINDSDKWPIFFSSYTWEAVDSKNNAVYKINVCGNVDLPGCGPTSAVCMCDLKTKTFRSVGK